MNTPFPAITQDAEGDNHPRVRSRRSRAAGLEGAGGHRQLLFVCLGFPVRFLLRPRGRRDFHAAWWFTFARRGRRRGVPTLHSCPAFAAETASTEWAGDGAQLRRLSCAPKLAAEPRRAGISQLVWPAAPLGGDENTLTRPCGPPSPVKGEGFIRFRRFSYPVFMSGFRRGRVLTIGGDCGSAAARVAGSGDGLDLRRSRQLAGQVSRLAAGRWLPMARGRALGGSTFFTVNRLRLACRRARAGKLRGNVEYLCGAVRCGRPRRRRKFLVISTLLLAGEASPVYALVFV